MDLSTKIEVHTGSHGPYEWLVTNHHLSALLELCPQIVRGNYVAITSLDSSPLFLSDEELASGWNSRGGIAYSPLISEPANIPREWYDEWYVLDAPREIGHLAPPEANVFTTPRAAGEIHAFVNFNLTIHLQEMDLLTQVFWGEIERIRPYAYLAQSDCWLTFVTADRTMFKKAIMALASVETNSGPQDQKQ
jgi:hypothetical protein